MLSSPSVLSTEPVRGAQGAGCLIVVRSGGLSPCAENDDNPQRKAASRPACRCLVLALSDQKLPEKPSSGASRVQPPLGAIASARLRKGARARQRWVTLVISTNPPA